MLLRSRVVLPISRPPIENGAVLIEGDRIAAVAPWPELSSADNEVIDLGDSILLPGLINAHCHLDYTGMAGKIPSPKSFPDWIKSILAFKAHWSYTEFAQSWLTGADMLLRNGTTTVADIEAVPELLPDVWQSTPLRVFSFLEMTGVKNRRPAREILDDAIAKIESLAVGRNSGGLSPHAPYSTSPELLHLTAEAARQRQWRVTTHVAESAAEFDMYQHRRGPLFEWLAAQRDMSDCGLGSPVQHLARSGLLGENFLGIHVNYLANGDAQLLAETHSHVVHCPRSHAYFGHHPFPRRELAAARANVCLGTDSLASATRPPRGALELDMLAEMRSLAAADSDLTPEILVEMATMNGARALGLSGQLGELRDGALADVIAIRFNGPPLQSSEAVLQHTGPVLASMINGVWALAPATA